MKQILFLFLTTALFCQCLDDSEMPECQASEPDPILIDIRDFNILPAYESLLSEVQQFRTLSEFFYMEPFPGNLDIMKSELKGAWKAWQEASAFEFGPAADLAFKANLNTFPVDSFSVLQRIEEQDFTLIANDTKGFPALDLLLNGIGNTDEEISAFFSGENGADYISYMSAVLLDLENRITEVIAAWENGYGDSFVTNTGFATGSSLSLFINAYIQDWEKTKRDRIALPLGLLTFEIPQPTRVECYYGGYSQELARAHVAHHRKMYKTQGYLGLHELVEEVTDFTGPNGETLDQTIKDQFDLCLAKLDVVPDPLSETVSADFDVVNEAYLALQDMVVLLKTDMTSGLGISINFADNDGD